MSNQQFSQAQIDQWRRFERVRKSGHYNMIVDAYYASMEAGLSKSQYDFVIRNYEALAAFAESRAVSA